MEEQGKVIVFLGDNAAGKTQRIEQLRRQWASDSVRYVAFADAYGGMTDSQYYLQLRWNQYDIDPETPTVGRRLEESYITTGPDTPQRRAWQQKLYATFHIEEMQEKYVILLSSGETRKLQLTRTLLSMPKTLIVDNPFIGLDTAARSQIGQLFDELAHQMGLTLYLILSRHDELPDYADETVLFDEPEKSHPEVEQMMAQRPATEPSPVNEMVIDMHDVTVAYGHHTILNRLSWQVRRGEHWALSGPNGSGKSTLLSLVCADNPQSYAHDIVLFGRKRGSGETIWDIKRRIGYVSPELHRSYRRQLTALRVVASGLKDTVGLYVRATEEECQRCLWWMRLLCTDRLAERNFLSLSSGEQRMVLLARAFVKDPDLLILDEPMHGLDERNSDMVKGVIDRYCASREKTLIMVSHYEEDLPSCIDKRLQLPVPAREVVALC